MKRFIPVLGLALVGAAILVAPAAAASLDVTATGFKHTRGEAIICLWKDGKGFPTCQKGTPLKMIKAPIAGGSVTASFANIPDGDYAVTVQHDEDGDGKLKTNFIGMPKEGIGVSNNPSGIPRFAKSLVSVKEGTKTAITMRYL